MISLRLLVQTVIAVSTMLATQLVEAQVSARACGPIKVEGDFGPYDYRYDKFFLPVVEKAHFTASVEALIRGKTGERVEPDLDYTLRKFPNHHRALAALLRLSNTHQRVHFQHLPLPVECYFERAVRFRGDDPVARMIYVRFLIVHKRLAEARSHLARVEEKGADSPLSLRNAGLLYLAMQDYDKALELAHRVMAKGAGEEPLKGQLQAAGRWREPGAVAAGAQAASAPPPAGAASAGTAGDRP